MSTKVSAIRPPLPANPSQHLPYASTVSGQLEEAQCSVDQATAVLELVHDRMLRRATADDQQPVQAIFAVLATLATVQRHIDEAMRIGLMK